MLPWDLTALLGPASLSPQCVFDNEARLDANYHCNHAPLHSALLPSSSLLCSLLGPQRHSPHHHPSTPVNGAFLIWTVQSHRINQLVHLPIGLISVVMFVGIIP